MFGLGFQGVEIALFAAVGLFVVVSDSVRPSWCVERVRRLVARLPWLATETGAMRPALVLGASAVVGTTVAYYWSLGGYRCGTAGPSDLVTLYTSGRAFLSGADPFMIAACGTTFNPVPAGMASVLLDALGSLAGPAGVVVVWGAVSVALLPLVWSLAGSQRLPATAFLLASSLYFPIVVSEDGASLAIVPLTVLLVLYLGQRVGWSRAAALGGFLATGRFPALFPVLGASGRAGAHRVVATFGAVAAFAVVTLGTFTVYGSRFLGPVFLLQFGRVSALNFWGILEGEGWLLPSSAVTVVQAGFTLALVAVCWLWVRSDLASVAILLTGTVLAAQFLSFNELVFLLPVALMGTRYRWWIWGIGGVPSVAAVLEGMPQAPAVDVFYGLCLLLTLLLVGLLVDLLRTAVGSVRPASGTVPEPLGPAP